MEQILTFLLSRKKTAAVAYVLTAISTFLLGDINFGAMIILMITYYVIILAIVWIYDYFKNKR